MMHISFFVEHKPVAKGRPRMGKGPVYTPAKTKAFETMFAWEAKRAMKGRPVQTGPCFVALSFRFAKPKKLDELSRHVSKPDLSNLVKAVEDAMNGIVYHDDCQIYAIKAEKVYSPIEGIFVDVLFTEG